MKIENSVWVVTGAARGIGLALARMDDHVVPQELVLRAMEDRDFSG